MNSFRLLLLILVIFSCSGRKNYHPQSFMPIDTNIDSEILEYQRTMIADTTLAYMSGKIQGKSIVKNDTILETLNYSNIWVKDLKTDSVIGTTSNKKGDYELIIPASRYDIEIQFIGYKNLKIENVGIGTGDIINFSCILVEGYGKTKYKIDSLYNAVKLN